MKKLLIIPLTFLVTSVLLTSCGNTNADTRMKAQVQNNSDTTNKKANKESDEQEKKEKEEKKNKTHKKTSFFKPVRIFNDATTKMIYKTQTDLWL
jgi:mannitol-specific phosphotransferase system IIBC component